MAEQIDAAYAQEREDLLDRVAELESLFDIRWKADQRAIKRWQDATGKHDTWPDRADMVVWLLEERDRLLAALDPDETKAAYIGEVKDDICQYGEDGEELWHRHTISWTAMKEFMALIRKRAGVE